MGSPVSPRVWSGKFGENNEIMGVAKMAFGRVFGDPGTCKIHHVHRRQNDATDRRRYKCCDETDDVIYLNIGVAKNEKRFITYYRPRILRDCMGASFCK